MALSGETEKAVTKQDALWRHPALQPFLKEDRAVLLWESAHLELIWASPAAQALVLALLDEEGRLESSLPLFPALRRLSRAEQAGLHLEKLPLDPSPQAPMTAFLCQVVSIPSYGTVLMLAQAGQPASRNQRAEPDLFSQQEPIPHPDIVMVRKELIEPFLETEEPVIQGKEGASLYALLPDQKHNHQDAHDHETSEGESGTSPSSQSSTPPSSLVPPSSALATTLTQPLPEGRLRFVWDMDETGRFLSVSESLASIVGEDHTALSGLTWQEAEGRFFRDPSGILHDMLARRETWTNRTLFWRIAGTQIEVPVDLSGVPAFNREKRFLGYRGFGICRMDDAIGPDGRPPLIEPSALFSAPEQEQALSSVGFDPWALRGGIEVTKAEFRIYQTIEARFTPLPDGHEVDGAAQESLEQETVDETAPNENRQNETGQATQEPQILLLPEGFPVADEPVLAPEPPSPEQDAFLSYSERHAFREIARALGARFGAESRVQDEDVTGSEANPIEEGTSSEQASPNAKESTLLSADRRRESPPFTGLPADNVVSLREAKNRFAAEAPPSQVPSDPLHESLRYLLERLPVAIVISREDVPLFANRAFFDLSGFSDIPAIIAHGGLDRLFLSRHALDPLKDPGEPAQKNTGSSGLALASLKEGPLPVEARLTTLHWEGQPASLLLIRRAPEIESTSDRRALELELRAAEGRIRELDSILDTATDGVVVIDDKGRILSLNSSAEALFGYDQNEVAGESLLTLFAPESHTICVEYWAGLRSNGMASLLNDGREVTARVRQGGTIPVSMTMGRISDGGEVKFCAILRDMSVFRKAESELIASRRAAENASARKSDFLARISHEIRTPLNAILGFAEVMQEERFGPVGNERYKDYLNDIRASGSYLISLVNDLLDLAKVEAGRMELSFTSVSLNDLVSECVNLLQPQANRAGIIIRTSFLPHLPPIVADDRSMRQVVLNILSNAIKFTDAGGQVILSTALTERGEAALRIRDTGIGMTEKEIESALEPFRQLATSRRSGGTGLGLPLTKALVEANRGTLTLSSARDEGTLVEVLFPPTRVLAE
jgi:PAS domain S-box-containing protein